MKPAPFSYIMTFRADFGSRTANLYAVLRWLSQVSDLEVVLVEQDCEPRISQNNLPTTCRYQFVSNDGPFNKSWGMNVGFKASHGGVLGFGDADLVLNLATLIDCYRRCSSDLYAVKPYDQLIDLNAEESQAILGGNFNVTIERPRGLRNREHIGEHLTFCGGSFLIQRNVFERLGGFDERFIGWGGEDDAMTVKLSRLVERHAVAQNQIAYHLWHERAIASRYLHSHYKDNLARAQWYAGCDVHTIQRLCEQDRSAIGQIDKYAAVLSKSIAARQNY